MNSDADRPRISFGAAVAFAVVAFIAGGFVVAMAGQAAREGLIATGVVGLAILGTALVVQRLAIGLPPEDEGNG